jgi:hypothetical protein
MTETTNARQTARQTAAANGWELEEGRGTDVFSRGAIRVAARWNAEGRLTNLGARDVEIDKAYTAVKGGRAALADLLTAPAAVTTQPAQVAVVPDTTQAEATVARQAAELPTEEAPAAAGFADSQGAALAVGDRIEIVAKGNNVRKQDVGATGTIRGTTRTRLLVDWDLPNSAAPRWPVLPALVTRQG